MAADLDLRHRLVLLEDYDITVARMLVGGVDVWLNTPLRPLEACGTSGMKAVFNGVLNCSVLDGWWDEMYDGDVGWAIPSAEWEDDLEARNEIEAASVFGLLERQVVPLFYNRDRRPARSSGCARSRRRSAGSARGSGADRMLREYTTDLYEPAAERTRLLRADDDARVKALVRWRRHLDRGWPSVAVTGTSYEELPQPSGTTYRVTAQVSLGDLDPSDVEVQLVYGAVDLDDELRDPTDRRPWTRTAQRRRTRAGAATPTSSTSTAPATSASPCASCRATPTCAATPTSARWPGRPMPTAASG